MKRTLLTISFILFTLTSLLAQQTPVGGIGGSGGGPKQSWQDIYRNPNLSPKFPEFDVEGRMISYKNLCLLGDRIRTKYRYVINKPTDLSKFIFDYLVTDRVREEEACVEYEGTTCVQYEIKVIEIPLKEKIKVFKKEETDNPPGYQWVYDFEKEFELKECEEE